MTTNPNPSAFGDTGTIYVHVTSSDSVVYGLVAVRDGAGFLCNGTLEFGRMSCTSVLSPGVHTLRAEYSPNGSPFPPSTATLQHVVNPVAGQHCAGYDDVPATHAICRNVDWIRNRGITLGCGGFDFCPDSAVSRLSMAAFMNRMGPSVTPLVVTTYASPGFRTEFGSTACEFCNIGAAEYPRRVYVDAILSGWVDGATDLSIRVEAFDASGGQGVLHEGPAMPTSVLANHYASVKTSATIDVAANTPFSLRIKIHKVGNAGASFLTPGSCTLRAVILQREETFAPHDRQP